VLGVDLNPGTGKSLFWNDRSGMLLVRATLQDLDTIEAAIQALNQVPHQVNIKAKFAEITQNDSRAVGFDWYLGNFLMGNGKIVGTGGTAPSYGGAPSSANPSGSFPGQFAPGDGGLPPTETRIPISGTDSLLTSGLRDSLSAPALATFTGILTDPQFRVVVKALEQRQGVDLLSAPEVTTVSGRQAQIQVVDIINVVVGVNQNSSQGGGQAAQTGGGTGTTVQQPLAVFQTPTTVPLPFGPALDVVPYISADGYTIEMTIIPVITEFLGYDLQTAQLFVPQTILSTGQSVESILPLPNYRVRQVTTSAVVWDGQTIVLGGLLSENVTRVKDKVPVLGDLPLLGRFFRSESSDTKKKNLLIFVTPTIIDPAGNRLHSEDEMPFAQTSIPAQKPVAGQP